MGFAQIFAPFERMIALRYLRPRREEGFVSVIAAFSFLGIMLGVATLIIVMSVMNGFRAELVGRILGLNGHITMLGLQGPIEKPGELAEKLRKVTGVIAAAPLVEKQAMATANKASTGAMVRGMRPADLLERKVVADHIVNGSIGSMETDPNMVMIGQRMARKLGLGVGSKITLIAPGGTVTAFGTVPRMKAYRVGAIFNVDMYQYDSSYIYMNIAAAQIFFRMKNKATGVEVLVDTPENLPRHQMQLQKVAGPGHRPFNWQQANKSFVNALHVERNVMFLILTLIIVVAAFNIISGLIMLVKDKTSDIAILRTMGAPRAAIMRIFFLSGASVGVTGTLTGVILGLAFSLNIETIRRGLEALSGTELFAAEIYFLSKLPAKVDPWEVAMVMTMALTVSFLATLYPSWRAARLDPVEALRYE